MQCDVDAIQNAVDEGRGLLCTEFFSDVDGLINGDLCRNIIAIQQFINGHPYDVSIHPRHPAYLPMLGKFLNQTVDFISTSPDTIDKLKEEGFCLFGNLEMAAEQVNSFVGVVTVNIHLEKNLHGKFS